MEPAYAGTIIWLLWTLSWQLAAFWRGRETGRESRRAYAPCLAVAFVGFFLLFVFQRRFPPWWRLAHPAAWTMIALVVIGLAFAWWARLHLGRLWSGGIVQREGHRVVDDGPYALVRHPIYTGMIFSAAALAAVKATAPALIGTALVALGFILKARVEERYLARQFNDRQYERYRARVPMIVPRPWPARNRSIVER